MARASHILRAFPKARVVTTVASERLDVLCAPSQTSRLFLTQLSPCPYVLPCETSARGWC